MAAGWAIIKSREYNFDNFPHSNAWATYVGTCCKKVKVIRVMIYMNFVD